MKKTRMSIDDIHAMAGSLRKNVLNMRVTNIYDLASTSDPTGSRNNKTYLLKLHQPPFPKVFLLLESGVRFHTSKYARDSASSTATLPSQFTMKLRKHLRGKRLVALTQLEGDRVVDFTFGADQLQCHLILELYASGNIILTDENYTILSLLRTHKFDENVKMAVRQVYPVSVLENKAAAAAGDDRGVTSAADLIVVVDKWFADQEARALDGKGKKPKVQTLKQLVLTKESGFGGLGPVIVEHCIVRAGLKPTIKIKNAGEFRSIGITELARLVTELRDGWKLLERLQSEQTTVIAELNEDGTPVETALAQTSETKPHCGFIILKDKKDPSEPDQFEEFTPFLYAQHLVGNKQVRNFVTFDDAVDEYFSHFEAQSAEAARQSAKAAAESKLDKLRKNQKQQIDQLIEVQEKSFRHAQLIEANQLDVENVLLVVRSALASGMDWRGLEELVRFEQRNGNPVACLIHELDLAHNRVAILLCDNDDDDDDDEDNEHNDDNDDDDEQQPRQQDNAAHVIWIDLSLSALANAREIYSKKKKAGEKVKKATEATDRAIQVAEKNTKKTLQKQQTKRHTIYQRRKTLWFEKFHWFISSENYLVIAGKDAHQNELLVKRYLRKGDVYVHADLHGAATCVVRNRMVAGGATDALKYPSIPVATLEQAGCMSVCRSNAWTSQVIAGAYWVHADQVSKTAPAGEYLTTGSFMIRGKKNYITPSRLEMGLAIVFRLDESSIANHADDADEDRVESGERRAEEAEQDDDGSVDGSVDAEDDDARQGDVELEEREEEAESSALDGAVDAKQQPDVAESAMAEVVVENVEVDESQAATVDNAPRVDVDVDEEATTANDAAEDEAAATAARDGKKRLTAKQRRDLKKGKPINVDTPTSGKDTATTTTPPPAPSASSSASQKHVRGKKGKLKKMKKKYADQDEDERRLRMEALGHAVGDDDEEPDDGGDGASSAKDGEGDDGETAINGDDAEGALPARKDKDADKHSDEYIRQQREKKEKYLEQEEEEAEGADFFDAFTGAPRGADLLLFAMPMCAPYAAVSKHKYKVKLTPGSVKKGKAAKSAMEHFFAMNLREEKAQALVSSSQTQAKSAVADTTDTEATNTVMTVADQTVADVEAVLVQRELMRCIVENELVACLVGPVKISAQGLHGSSAGGGAGKKGGSGKKGGGKGSGKKKK